MGTTKAKPKGEPLLPIKAKIEDAINDLADLDVASVDPQLLHCGEALAQAVRLIDKHLTLAKRRKPSS